MADSMKSVEIVVGTYEELLLGYKLQYVNDVSILRILNIPRFILTTKRRIHLPRLLEMVVISESMDSPPYLSLVSCLATTHQKIFFLNFVLSIFFLIALGLTKKTKKKFLIYLYSSRNASPLKI